MEPIDGLEKLMRLIRSKATKKISRADGSGASTSYSPSARPQLPPQAAMEQELRTKIRQLTELSASPQTVSLAVIGTLLAWEFDDSLHNEPKFNTLVQQVHLHIESEPRIKAAFLRIIDRLHH